MAERKKYPYDEKAKERTMRCLKKNWEEVRLTVRKGTKEMYKAYAATKGISMTALMTSLMEREMAADGFVYSPEEESPGEE